MQASSPRRSYGRPADYNGGHEGAPLAQDRLDRLGDRLGRSEGDTAEIQAPRPPLFPYTTLFRSLHHRAAVMGAQPTTMAAMRVPLWLKIGWTVWVIAW